MGHIVIMNVFTGLAVGDVEAVQATAKNQKMLSQMKFVINFIQGRGFLHRFVNFIYFIYFTTHSRTVTKKYQKSVTVRGLQSGNISV